MSMEYLNKTYAYRCTFCGIGFELTITNEPGITVEDDSGNIILGYCPQCGSVDLFRDYKNENVGVVYKGSGFTKQVKNDE